MKANLRLKHERQSRGWSQAKVAAVVGTDPATVGRWERGLSFPYPFFREKLCALFEKNAHELGLVQESSPVETTEVIYDPTIPLLSIIGTKLIGRDALLFELKQQLLSPETVALTALNGIPGVGKTALAIQLVYDEEVREHFSDGILWAALGRRPNVINQLSRWANLLGISSSTIQDQNNILHWAEALHETINTRRILLIIDDAWRVEDTMALKVGGPNCACIVTTRFPAIALQTAGEGATMVEELNEDDSMALMHCLVPGIIDTEQETIRALVKAVGGLPLALKLMGKYLRVQAHSKQPRRIRMALHRLLDTRERLELPEPQALVERHPSLNQEEPYSLHSIIMVSDQLLDENAREALRCLAVFPAKPSNFSEEAALFVTRQSLDVLDALSDAGLLESSGSERYMLHQTIADYASLHLQDETAHRRFISYYTHYIEGNKSNCAVLECELNNILAALDRAEERGMQQDFIAGVHALTFFMDKRGLYSHAYNLLQRAYAYTQDRPYMQEHIDTLLYLGQVLGAQKEYPQAILYLHSGLEYARQAEQSQRTCEFLYELARVLHWEGRNDEAQQYLEEGLRLAISFEDRTYLTAGIVTLLNELAYRDSHSR